MTAQHEHAQHEHEPSPFSPGYGRRPLVFGGHQADLAELTEVFDTLDFVTFSLPYLRDYIRSMNSESENTGRDEWQRFPPPRP